MTAHDQEIPAITPLRDLLEPKSLVWMTRKDTWYFLLSLVLGSGFSLVFGCVLFLVNR